MTAVVVWDETVNPASNHKYWMAKELISALPAAFAGLAAGTCGSFGLALLLTAPSRGLAVTLFVPEATSNDVLERLLSASARVVKAGRTYEDAVAASRRAAVAGNLADGNVDGPWGQEMIEGIARRAKTFFATRVVDRRTRLWIPTGNGTTIAGCYLAISELGLNVEVHAVSSEGNNSITSSLSKRLSHHAVLSPESISESSLNSPLCNWNALHGKAAVSAILRSSGSAVEVSDGELHAASMRLSRLGVPATPAGAAGLAGLLGRGSLPGTTDIVLVTSRFRGGPGAVSTSCRARSDPA